MRTRYVRPLPAAEQRALDARYREGRTPFERRPRPISLCSPPTATLQGLPTHNWSGPLVSRHLQEKYQLRLSDDQARRVLRKLEYRQVRARLAKGDPEAE